jgi:hypothetical protein
MHALVYIIMQVSVVSVMGVVIVVMGPVIMTVTCVSEDVLLVIKREPHLIVAEHTVSKGKEIAIVVIIIFE